MRFIVNPLTPRRTRRASPDVVFSPMGRDAYVGSNKTRAPREGQNRAQSLIIMLTYSL